MSLKVFDLQCAAGHVFEGWFSSYGDYDTQLERGLLTCPVCDDHDIVKRLSAPRLNVANIRAQSTLTGHRQAGRRHGSQSDTPAGQRDSARTDDAAQGDGASAASLTTEAAQVARLQAALFRQVRQIISSAENVGPRFAEEARRLHEEGRAHAIRGTATRAEREALADDGIDVMTVPDIFDDERLQ